MKEVRELRDRTGAGILDCKRALDETGDVEDAIEYLQQKGIEGAEDLSERTASEGTIALWENGFDTHVVMVEVNSETDFAARRDEFSQFADRVATTAGRAGWDSVEDATGNELEDEAGNSVGEFREQEKSLTASLGENIRVRRIKGLGEAGYLVFSYLHSNNQVGAAVKIKADGDTEVEDVREFGKDIAMQIAAMNPSFLDKCDVSDDVVESKKDMFAAQMREKGKPEQIIPKIVDGKLDKWLSEKSLRTQSFIKDDMSVGEYEDTVEGVSIVDFMRMEVGEGINRNDRSFAEEVREQL